MMTLKNPFILVLVAMTSFHVVVNATPFFSVFNDEKKPDAENEPRTTLGTLGSLLEGNIVSKNRVVVNSTELGNTAGYILAGTFLAATVLYNWDKSQTTAKISEKEESTYSKDDTVRRSVIKAQLASIPRICENYCSKWNDYSDYSDYSIPRRSKR